MTTTTPRISWDRVDGLMSAARLERSQYLGSCIAGMCGAFRRPIILWASIGAALAFALIGTAQAANIEYGEYYEQKYITACIQAQNAAACACTMESVQAEISFSEFADLVDRYDGDISRDDRHAAAIRSAQGRCLNRAL